MRRIVILTLLLIALFLPLGRAQFVNVFDNTYISFGAGPNYYFNRDAGTLGAGFDASVGKWMINTFSLRGQLSMRYANRGSSSSNIVYAYVDALFDVFVALKGQNSSRFRSYILIGTGLAHSLHGDNDFCTLFGAGVDWAMRNDCRLFSELGLIIHPSDFDYNSSSSLLPSLLFGITRDIRSNPMRRRSREETRCFVNDWAFQVTLGVSSLNYRGVGSVVDRLQLLTPIVEFGLEKTFTNVWSGRFIVSGLYSKSREETFSYYNVRGDIMFDVIDFFSSKQENSRFDLKPYFGASIIARLDEQSRFLLGTAFGSVVSYHMDKQHSLFFDARYLITPHRFAHVQEKQGTFSVGLATLTFGYSYTFTHSSF